MSAGKKKPKFSQDLNPTTSKSPKTPAIKDFNFDSPSWRIRRLEMCDPFGWHQIERSKIMDIQSKLGNFETMTWNEILVAGAKRNHPIPISKICRQAQERLRDLNLDDVDDVVSLHLSGTERVWGIRQDTVLLLLWWDPDHKIYPYQKKNS